MDHPYEPDEIEEKKPTTFYISSSLSLTMMSGNPLAIPIAQSKMRNQINQ